MFYCMHVTWWQKQKKVKNHIFWLLSVKSVKASIVHAASKYTNEFGAEAISRRIETEKV